MSSESGSSSCDILLTFIRVWKPLFGPLVDWPLAVCDAASINIDRDMVAMDHVHRLGESGEGRVVENYAVHYSPDQRWHYLSKQRANELLLFRQVDTAGNAGGLYSSR